MVEPCAGPLSRLWAGAPASPMSQTDLTLGKVKIKQFRVVRAISGGKVRCCVRFGTAEWAQW